MNFQAILSATRSLVFYPFGRVDPLNLFACSFGIRNISLGYYVCRLAAWPIEYGCRINISHAGRYTQYQPIRHWRMGREKNRIVFASIGYSWHETRFHIFKQQQCLKQSANTHRVTNDLQSLSSLSTDLTHFFLPVPSLPYFKFH